MVSTRRALSTSVTIDVHVVIWSVVWDELLQFTSQPQQLQMLRTDQWTLTHMTSYAKDAQRRS